MLLKLLPSLLLGLEGVYGLADIGALLVHSAQRSQWPNLSDQQVASAQHIESALIESCPTNDVVIVSQIQLSYNHIHHMPLLKRRIEGQKNGTTVQIPQIIGTLDLEKVISRLRVACTETAISLHLLEDDAYSRSVAEYAASSDLQLDELLAVRSTPFTFVFVSAGAKSHDHYKSYDMDEPYPPNPRTDLRRNLDSMDEVVRLRDDGKAAQNLALFETYQFLSPAIFMGLGVSILLMSILYIALSALSSMEVSYKAFSKEMGAQAQKSKQQ